MKLIVAILALSLTGCAHEYAAYAEAQKAQAQAQAAKYAALAEIAKMGDTTAKVAAVMSINGFGNGQQQQQINPPRHWADYALSFTGALLPVVGQVYAVNKQSAVAIAQSNNATTLGIAQANSNRDVQTATSTAFVSMANTGFKATSDIAASGFSSASASASAGFTAIGNTATAGLTAATAIAGKIQAPQPNITLSGTGVIGNGTYTQTTMSGTGVLGTGTYTTDNRPTDNHAVSTSTSSSTSLTCTTGPC
jgi:PBP1b-binding outer membrane lipoprotein LpoB